jgi:hypothetical protein
MQGHINNRINYIKCVYTGRLFQDALIIHQGFSSDLECLTSSEKQFTSLVKNTDCEVFFFRNLLFCIISFGFISLFDYYANTPQPGEIVGDGAARL